MFLTLSSQGFWFRESIYSYCGELTQLPSVFEHLHKAEIKKAKDEGVMTSNQLETIVHPNEYFKRSYLLKNLGKETDVKMEG